MITFDRANNELKIIQCNVQSLHSNKSELQRVLTAADYDVALLSETWTQDALENSIKYRISGYHQLNHSRYDNYGGVAILLKDCFNYFKIQLPTVSDFTQVVALRVATIDIVLVSLYVSPSIPNATFEDDISNIFVSLRSFRRIVIGGDLNAHHSGWGNEITDKR